MAAVPDAAKAANKRRNARDRRYFLRELNYLLSWPLAAEDIAAHLNSSVEAVERRLKRAIGREHPLAERFRQRKPGYCPHCRLVDFAHRRTCPDWNPPAYGARSHRPRAAA